MTHAAMLLALCPPCRRLLTLARGESAFEVVLPVLGQSDSVSWQPDFDVILRDVRAVGCVISYVQVGTLIACRWSSAPDPYVLSHVSIVVRINAHPGKLPSPCVTLTLERCLEQDGVARPYDHCAACATGDCDEHPQYNRP